MSCGLRIAPCTSRPRIGLRQKRLRVEGKEGGARGGHGHERKGSGMRPKRARGVPDWVWGTHADGSALAFGGAPYGGTKRVR
eukprot:6930437-Pyramimonas_sp.AAC.1